MSNWNWMITFIYYDDLGHYLFHMRSTKLNNILTMKCITLFCACSAGKDQRIIRTIKLYYRVQIYRNHVCYPPPEKHYETIKGKSK